MFAKYFMITVQQKRQLRAANYFNSFLLSIQKDLNSTIQKQILRLMQQTQLVGFKMDITPDNSDDDNENDRQGEQQILETFFKPLPVFRVYEKNAGGNITNLEVIQKKVVAFAAQYGTNNDNTMKMVLSYLENVKDFAFQKFLKNQIPVSLYLLTKCLGFITPIESPYRYKFITVKIDVVSKLMYILMNHKKKQDKKAYSSQLETSITFIQYFLDTIESMLQYRKLCIDLYSTLETNYLLAGSAHYKFGIFLQSTKYFEKTLYIVDCKLNEINKFENKDHNTIETQNRLHLLRIDTYYKMSKSYRLDDPTKQQINERKALQEAKLHNNQLHLQILRKIRQFNEKKKFKAQLNRLDNRKKIQSEVLRLIEESRHSQKSLYSFYQNEDDKVEETNQL